MLPLFPASTQHEALVRSMSKTLSGPDHGWPLSPAMPLLRRRCACGLTRQPVVSHLLQDLTLACLTDRRCRLDDGARRHYRQQKMTGGGAGSFSHATPGGWPQFLAAAAAAKPATRPAPAWLVQRCLASGRPPTGCLSLGRLSDAEISAACAAGLERPLTRRSTERIGE